MLDFQSLTEGVQRLESEEVVLLEYLETVSSMTDYYPCSIAHVPGIKLANIYSSFPFKKGDPMAEVFSRQLSKDLQLGKVDKIMTEYLGRFKQVFMPIIIKVLNYNHLYSSSFSGCLY